MILLGIEGGGTRTSSLLVDSSTQEVIASFQTGPGNVHLLPGQALEDHFLEIRECLPRVPDGIGLGMAGVRTSGDRARVGATVARIWPGVAAVVEDDLIPALEATQWPENFQVQVLILSGTGSCFLGRKRDGSLVKVGGRGHVIGDRGSAMDIARHALRSVVTIYDLHGELPALGVDILNFLQMNDPESLIEWSMMAGKTELASVAQVVFQAMEARHDEDAQSILEKAMYHLTKDALTCADRISSKREKVQFILNGGVLLKNPSFLRNVVDRLEELRPGSLVTPLDRPSVWGCVALAQRTVEARLESSIPRLSNETVDSTSTPSASSTVSSWKSIASSPTEGRHPESSQLSEMPVSDAIRLMLKDSSTIPSCILAESEHIEWTIQRIVQAFSEGGRLIYCGAGTSGRLGVLDASECPPTFRSPVDQVQGIIAGGNRALWSAIEGAEDDKMAGRSAVRYRNVRPSDIVIGISASGHAPFVWGCLEEAKTKGASTVLVCCNPGYRDHPLLDRAILPNTGPEILTGSTRLKAGTATKIVLNLLTTLAMTHFGKVIGNLMVDLNPSNTKLRDRAIRIVQELTGVSERHARRALEASSWVVRDTCTTLGRKA